MGISYNRLAQGPFWEESGRQVPDGAGSCQSLVMNPGGEKENGVQKALQPALGVVAFSQMNIIEHLKAFGRGVCLHQLWLL